MFSVAFAVWPDKVFTSEATTAKPRPASPARAASMVALSASMLVCEAIWSMLATMSTICAAAVARVEALVEIACKAAPMASIEAVEAPTAAAPSFIRVDARSMPARTSAPTEAMPCIEESSWTRAEDTPWVRASMARTSTTVREKAAMAWLAWVEKPTVRARSASSRAREASNRA